MDIKKIYVIIDNKNYNQARVISELKSEGYPHNFFFGNSGDFVTISDLLMTCDEVWCFGDCENIMDYKMAKDVGSDCWKMG